MNLFELVCLIGLISVMTVSFFTFSERQQERQYRVADQRTVQMTVPCMANYRQLAQQHWELKHFSMQAEGNCYDSSSRIFID